MTALPLTCPACRSARTAPAFLSYRRCRGCKTVFDAEPPSDDAIAEIYEGVEYFVKDGARPDAGYGYAADYLADRPFIEAKFDRVLAHLERYVKPGRLLDVGSGPGFLLEVAERRGWTAVGVDLNEWAVTHAREELGVDVRLGPLTVDMFESERFDALTMMDVVEHVPSFDDLLADASALVRPGGGIALLTPHAGAPLSRLLGHRWPEVVRGEHAVLFSVAGLSKALARHGFAASGWHTIGKQARIADLLADATAMAPAWAGHLRSRIAAHSLGARVLSVDPRTKFCLYARRLPDSAHPPAHAPARIPKAPERLAHVEQAIVEELESMADSPRLCGWMFDTFAQWVPGARVLEVGAGIGTATGRMLEAGASLVVAMEPEAICAVELEETFAGDSRVVVTREALPDAPSLADAAEAFDLVVCQNVLEHIGDDLAALEAMHKALRSGGRLSLLVPARPALFGALDDAYGHWRRYDEDLLVDLLTAAGFVVEDLHPHNALGIVGWWAKNLRPGNRVDARSLRVYETLVRVWRPLEERLRLRTGLSLVCTARKP